MYFVLHAGQNSENRGQPDRAATNAVRLLETIRVGQGSGQGIQITDANNSRIIKGEVEMAKSMQGIIEKAREEISKITGLELSSTIGAVKEEKGWKVTMEMVEKHSLPDQMDILAAYVVILDNDGNVIEFKRAGLRKRVDTEAVETE